jgi:hypothetical protein|nr:hypothetical protein [Panacagrimonas sp.]
MHPRLVALIERLPEARTRFESARARYAEIRTRALRESALSAWFEGPHHAPTPLALQRMGIEPAPPMRREPAPGARAHACRYGLGSDGRIRVEQHFTEFVERAYEEFWEYADEEIRTSRYDHYEPDKDPINVQTVLLARAGEMRRPEALIRYAQHGVALEAYEYDPARPHLLRRVHAAASEHDPASPQHRWMTTIDDIHHAADGALLRIVRTWDTGSSETIYPADAA